MAVISIFLIKFYQYTISPDRGFLFPNRVRSCRFYPSCSEYTMKALKQYGFWKGWIMGVRRIGRCHPWSEGGYDPVKNYDSITHNS